MSTEPASRPPESADRSALRRAVEQVCVVLLRNSLPVLAADALMVYAVVRDGALWLALAWFVAMETFMLMRRRFARQVLVAEHTDPAASMRQFIAWSAAQGVLRGLFVLLAFVAGSYETQVLVNMVTVGLAAGAVATCGGDVRVFRVWSYGALGSLAVCWAAQLSWVTTVVALLIVYLHQVLAGYVVFLGKQGRQLIDYAAELETERDRVRLANTELARVSDELRAERDRAAEANAAKTRVLASVSHDLRQPLFALSLNTAALGDTLERLDDPYLARIEEGLRRGLTQCRGLLDQLVDFSRLEAGTVEVRWRSLELGPFLQGLAAPYEAAARAAGLDFRLQLGARPLHAWTDPLLLERLLGNLLQNAVKFTARGCVGLSLQASADGTGVSLEVIDTGPGIAAEEQERVFEEFYQLDNPSRDRSRGIGLGLSIVRRLAALLGIDVKLHSAVGEGCRFALRLPASSGPARAEALAATDVFGPAPNGRGKVVLAIDDEADLLADLSTMLGGCGYQVLTAVDADEACRQARQLAPDIVLADFRLRNQKTGPTAVQAVRSLLGHDVPALIITGETDVQRLAEATASGLRVLHKPLDGRAVTQAVEEALAQAPGHA